MLKPESEFPFAGKVFRIGNLDAFEQFHVGRRLTPIIAAGGLALFQQLAAKSGDEEELNRTELMLFMAPIADALAKMSQDDADFVIKTCLKVVHVRAADSWAPLLNNLGDLMQADLQLPVMLRLVVQVLNHNLGSFFTEALGAVS